MGPAAVARAPKVKVSTALALLPPPPSQEPPPPPHREQAWSPLCRWRDGVAFFVRLQRLYAAVALVVALATLLLPRLTAMVAVRGTKHVLGVASNAAQELTDQMMTEVGLAAPAPPAVQQLAPSSPLMWCLVGAAVRAIWS